MGLLTSILPTPQGLPTNITPSQGFNPGGFMMNNLPYGGGLLYNGINTLSHAIQGTMGQHGPAPSLIGRIMQYINPSYQQGGLPANQQLPQTDPDYGNPNYIGLGDPVNSNSYNGGGTGGLLPPLPSGMNYPFYGQQSPVPGETLLPGGGAVGGIDPNTGQPVYQPLGTLPSGQPQQPYSDPFAFSEIRPTTYVGGGGGNQGPWGASPNFRLA